MKAYLIRINSTQRIIEIKSKLVSMELQVAINRYLKHDYWTYITAEETITI